MATFAMDSRNPVEFIVARKNSRGKYLIIMGVHIILCADFVAATREEFLLMQ